jgi:hypothetical protein
MGIAGQKCIVPPLHNTIIAEHAKLQHPNTSSCMPAPHPGINRWALQGKIVQRLVPHKITISSYWQLEKNTILFLENKKQNKTYVFD